MPKDSHQRNIDYLRISVVDACNLRCPYCMPLDNMRFLPREELLTAQEIRAVVAAATAVGFQKFRLTGGEPTLRRDIVDIVRAVRSVPGVRELAMTTNGTLLPRLGKELAAAGLDRVNLHLDSLVEERLRQVMRRHDLERARAGIEAAVAAGLTPLKLNTVVVRDLNDGDVIDLARLTLERDWHVRFIELMPLGGGPADDYSRTHFVPTRETRLRIEGEFGPLRALADQHPSDESRNYRIDGAAGVVGFISPVSAPFCGGCNRMRLTPRGRLHLCLLREEELDVRDVLRGGGGEEELRERLLESVRRKPVGHRLDQGRSNSALAMHQIGG